MEKKNREAIKADIAATWRDDTDEIVAARHGVSRQYVMKTRQRMGLSKNLSLIKEIRSLRPRNVKYFMQSRRYKLLPAWQQAEYRAWCRANGEKPL